MMQHIATFQAIGQALETKQAGTPVSVRLVVHTAADWRDVEDLAAQTLDAALGWLDDSPQSLFAQGGENDQQITLLLRTAGGRTALVSVGTSRGNTPAVEATVFGNRGLISWEGGCAAASPREVASGERTPNGLKALALLKQSLATGSVALAGQAAETHHAGKVQPPKAVSLPKPTPQAPPYGVLLVAGDYTHQPGYAEALIAGGRCKLIGLADENNLPPARQQLNKQLADRLGIPVFPDLGQALQRKDIDIVSICAEPYRRGRIIVQAAAAGKHLYLDKPLAGSLEDADAIVAAVRKAGVVAHMFTQMSWEPARSARDVLASGILGELVAIHCDACFAKGPAGTADLGKPRRESPAPQRYELADAKRELTNIGVYPVAMLLWLLQCKVQRVYGVTGNFFFAEHQANDMEDFGQMLMQLEGGITATVTAGRAGWRSHPSSGLHRVCLVGTKAAVTIDSHRPRVEIWADVEPWTSPSRDPGDPMGMWFSLPDNPHRARPKRSWVTPASPDWADDANYFLDCIEQGRQSEMSVDVAAASTEILLAAYRSATANEVFELPLPRR